jgi:hypothetical protein
MMTTSVSNRALMIMLVVSFEVFILASPPEIFRHDNTLTLFSQINQEFLHFGQTKKVSGKS